MIVAQGTSAVQLPAQFYYFLCNSPGSVGGSGWERAKWREGISGKGPNEKDKTPE
jgi:hypothetical protein